MPQSEAVSPTRLVLLLVAVVSRYVATSSAVLRELRAIKCNTREVYAVWAGVILSVDGADEEFDWLKLCNPSIICLTKESLSSSK